MNIIPFLLLLLSGVLLAKDVHFDYFVFTQQWPPAVCVEANSSGHVCSIPSNVHGWVIHGLWPSKDESKMGPAFCNNSYAFDESKLKSIEAQMRLNWPNLFADSPDLSFWKHEWKKHGTCSLSDKLIPDEFTYFNTALNLFKKLNITEMLGKSGIIPNTYAAYMRNDFCSAIIHALNVVPIVTCIYNRDDDRHYVMQIEICIDKDLYPIDCPTDYSRPYLKKYPTLLYKAKHENSCSTCPAKKEIWYPPISK